MASVLIIFKPISCNKNKFCYPKKLKHIWHFFYSSEFFKERLDKIR